MIYKRRKKKKRKKNQEAKEFFRVDLLGKSLSHSRILNIYNLWIQRISQMMVSPLVAFPKPFYPTLVVGDFNIH